MTNYIIYGFDCSMEKNKSDIEQAKIQLLKSFDYIMNFSGFGHLEVDIRILKRGQKEILIRCGREHRLVLDFPDQDKVSPGSASEL